jgi:predicted transcriptional regulator
MDPISIKLSKQLQELLDTLAKQRGLTRSAVVREALQAYAAESGTGATAAAAAGDLVGSLDGPRDLSTSAKHMRGFGE